MRKVCVFTSTRADYGLLRSLIHQLEASPSVDLQVIVSGSHLSEAYGGTVSEIEADGIHIDRRVNILGSDDSAIGVCENMGVALSDYGQCLAELRPDILVILGDRYEAFCMAAAAQVLRVQVAHLHGGEITEGLIDEAFRHSISKMAQFHFCSSETYRRRVIQLGELPERVYNVGALGVENILNQEILSLDELAQSVGVNLTRPFFLGTFHPVTLEENTSLEQLEELLAALDHFPEHQVVFTKANADGGGVKINERLESAMKEHPERFFCFASLGLKRYLSAVKLCDLVVGNSSSGILEVPALGVPTVNIGDRQKGRLGFPSIINCSPDADSIAAAIRESLKPSFRNNLKGLKHPCDGGATAQKITDVLVSLSLPNSLKKSFYDLQYEVPDNRSVK